MARTRAGREVLKETLITFSDLLELLTFEGAEDTTYMLDSYMTGANHGGDPFRWSDTMDKALADGGLVIDPDNTGGYDGTYATLPGFLAAQGGGVGSGCWIRDHNTSLDPAFWGADPTGVEDSYASLQKALDALKASYSVVLDGFFYILDFQGATYKTETSLDFALLRQPGSLICNGGLHGSCAGKAVLDCSGTNTTTIKDMLIFGDKDDAPSIGVLFSRALISGTFPSAAGNKLLNVFVNGYFSKSSYVNIASEVSQSSSCRFLNRHRAVNAYAYVNVGNAITLERYLSGGVTSEYCTLPTSADGSWSNILHYVQQAHIQRAADVIIAITNITKANPAVIEVDPTDLTNSELANGDNIFLHTNVGMEELNHETYEIANVDLGLGTFELVGIDSTSYSTFVSGQVWNQTGPAMLLNESNRLYMEASYILTYGNVAARIDMQDVAPIRACTFNFQAEAHPYTVFEFRRTTLTELNLQGLTFNSLNAAQVNTKDVFRITGGGTIKIDNLVCRIDNMGTAPQNGVFFPAAGFRLHNAEVAVPLDSALNPAEDFISFSGVMAASDTNKVTHRASQFDLVPSTDVMTEPGLRFSADSLISYREEAGIERRVQVQDTGLTVDFTTVGSRINVYDKWPGKKVYNVTTQIPMFSTGSTANSVWKSADGSVVYTPI